MPIALCVVIVVLVAALVLRERDHDRTRRAEQEDWALERRELLTRIQHPQLVPHTRQDPLPPAPEPPRDAAILARIGQIAPGYLMENEDGFDDQLDSR